MELNKRTVKDNFPIAISIFTLISLIFAVGIIKTTIENKEDEVQVITKIEGPDMDKAKMSCDDKLKYFVYEQNEDGIKTATECLDPNPNPANPQYIDEIKGEDDLFERNFKRVE